MINNLFRGSGLILFIIILIMDDFPFYKKLKLPHIQLILAILVTSLCIVDYVSGLIYALVLMLIYYEVYNKKKNIVVKDLDKYDNNVNKKILENFDKNNYNHKTTVESFISAEYLSKAANDGINIISNKNPITDNNIDYDAGGQKKGDIIGYDIALRSNNYSDTT